MPYSDWRQLLLGRFPRRNHPVAQRDWDAVKQQLAVGRSVSGTVIAKAEFGAWLDIGVGFPACS